MVLTASLAAMLPAAAAEISGAPTIIDGDSLEVAGRRFDLYGIDAPEPGEVCRDGRGKTFDCGLVARTALLDLTAGSEVACRPVGEPAVGRGPAIAATCTAGGFSLNRNMVHTGWALADRAVSTDYLATEREAKQARRGLWRWQFELPPWPARTAD